MRESNRKRENISVSKKQIKSINFDVHLFLLPLHVLLPYNWNIPMHKYTNFEVLNPHF